MHRRVIREITTIEKMIVLYCKREHKTAHGVLCAECSGLLNYAQERLTHCPFGENKSTCAKCTVHCYKPQMRLKIRRIMASSGPEMLARHPILTVRHFLDGMRSAPTLPKKKDNQTF
jgi:hypothetical protein